MTSDSDALLQQVANPGSEKTDLPSPSELVTALLETEKIAKKSQISGSFAQLIGTWRLCFVTGTKGKKSGGNAWVKENIYLVSFRFLWAILLQKNHPRTREKSKIASIWDYYNFR